MRLATRQALRPMRLEDISQVLEIERESFATMWPPTAYKRELEQNSLAHYVVVVQRDADPTAGIEADAPGHHGAFERLFGELRHILGTEEERELPPADERAELVTGVLGVWMLADEAHIVTLAVRESHRRRGIAELLLISAIDLAQARGQELVTLECRVSNEPALALYDKYGFQRVGLRPRYYSDNHEDAYVLSLNAVLSRSFQARFRELRADHERRWGRFDVDG